MNRRENLLSSVTISEVLSGYESSAGFVQGEIQRWPKVAKFSGARQE